MAELVDALVSGTSAARRGGSSPLLGTICSFVPSANGTVLFGTGNTLTTAGDQIYNGQVTGGTVAMTSTGGGDIRATATLNHFTGDLSITTTGDADIVDANSLALGASSAASLQALALGGDLTVNGIIQLTRHIRHAAAAVSDQ
jgi:hypothetical protein